MDEIKKFINSIECMPDIRKEFYKKLMEQRYEYIKSVYENIIFTSKNYISMD